MSNFADAEARADWFAHGRDDYNLGRPSRSEAEYDAALDRQDRLDAERVAERHDLPEWFREPLHYAPYEQAPKGGVVTCAEHPEWRRHVKGKLQAREIAWPHVRHEHAGVPYPDPSDPWVIDNGFGVRAAEDPPF